MRQEERVENGMIRHCFVGLSGLLAMTVVITCFAVSSTIASALELSVSNAARKSSRPVEGEVIIEIKEGIVGLGDEKGIVPQEKVIIKSESIQKLNKRFGLISIERLFSGTRKDVPSDIYVFRFSKDVNINDVISTYKGDSSVLYVEPNYTVHIE